MTGAFVGRYAPRAAAPGAQRCDAAALERALHRDGPAQAVNSGPLSLGWTTTLSPTQVGEVTCLLDGRPRATNLAIALGIDPETKPARTVAIGYPRLGVGLLSHLEGEYALVLWDPRSGHGLVARDRLGSVPVFLAERAGGLIFGSEVRNLLAMMPQRPDPDPVAMVDWLASTQARDDRTLYAGVRRVPAGHALVLEPGGWCCVRHWHPRYRPPAPLATEEAAELLATGIDEAVGHALEGARRPGLMLSGGFDSATVGAVAGRHLSGRALTAYSGVFPSAPEVDERTRIAAVRDWLGLRGVEAQLHEGSALAGALTFLETWELPSASPNLSVWLPLHRRAAADGIDVMLDGEGGDELLGCAPYLVADQLRAGRPGAAVALARRLPGMGAHPRGRWVLRALARYGLRGALPYGPHERLRRLRRRPVPGWLNTRSVAIHRARDDPWAWKHLSRVRWWAQLADLLTVQGDRLGATEQYRREGVLAGLEFRHPLRDPDLVELVLGLPPEPAFDARLDRALARRALRDRLPAEFLATSAKPFFGSVLSASLRGRDRAALSALLADPHPELARRVRVAAVASLLEAGRGARPPASWATELWRLASIEIWLDLQLRPERIERVREQLRPEPAVSFLAA